MGRKNTHHGEQRSDNLSVEMKWSIEKSVCLYSPTGGLTYFDAELTELRARPWAKALTVHVHGNLHIEDGGLSGKYSLEHFHFHWGSNDGVGSEHVLDGVSYPFEMHLVHKTRRHKKISKALADPTGLAVLGVFAKIGKHHPHLQKIIEGLEALDIGDASNIQLFAISSLFPEDTETFYRYQGSLTTPPCSESVVWTVFKEPIEMSETQMDRIRGLSMLSNITDNYRPVQSLNGRWVSIRKKTGEVTDDIYTGPDSGSPSMIPSLSVFIGALLFLFVRWNL